MRLIVFYEILLTNGLNVGILRIKLSLSKNTMMDMNNAMNANCIKEVLLYNVININHHRRYHLHGYGFEVSM